MAPPPSLLFEELDELLELEEPEPPEDAEPLEELLDEPELPEEPEPLLESLPGLSGFVVPLELPPELLLPLEDADFS